MITGITILSDTFLPPGKVSDSSGSSTCGMSYLYATAFANVGRTLTAQQKETLARMRTSSPSDPRGPFLYSSPIRMPKIEDTDFLFGVSGTRP